MVAAPLMTFEDLYVCVTLLAILFTPVVLAVGWFEHRDGLRQAWSEYRQRSADHRAAVRMRANPPGLPHIVSIERWQRCEPEERLAAIRSAAGAGVLIVPSDLHYAPADDLGVDLAAALREPLAERGTVQRPSDPSPRPRIRRLIEDGIRQQNRDAELRARAEGDQQR